MATCGPRLLDRYERAFGASAQVLQNPSQADLARTLGQKPIKPNWNLNRSRSRIADIAENRSLPLQF